MRHIDKRQFVGFLLVVFVLFLASTLLAGCGEDSNGYLPDDENGIIKPDASRSAITSVPSRLPPDGESEATVTVSLFDRDEKPVPDQSVYLETTLGEITSENPSTTDTGRAEFTLRSSEPGLAKLSLRDFPEIRPAEMAFGTVGSGIPASIRVVSVEPKEIAVSGSGQEESSLVRVRIVDEANNRVRESDYTLRASFLARPQGYEELSESGVESNRDYDEIKMEIDESGEVWFNIKSGNVPGIIEVLLEVLDNGQPLDPPVTAVIPQISVASGKPHILSLSAPRVDAIVNLNKGPDEDIPQTPGFYSRSASLSVLDRWGNAVPDGTIINIGVLDTVIASGTGSITENTDLLTDTGGNIDFTNASVERNNTERKIQPGDRVLIRNAKARNKTRFVHGNHPAIGSASHLYVGRPYQDSESDRNYVVGASLLGASLYGIDEDGTATKGTVRTRNGLGQIRLVYPANSRTIRLGSVPNDMRFEPGSARVITVFATSDDSATMVDEGTLSFSSIAGWSLTARPEEISSQRSVTFTVVDGGDEIPLPFVNIVPNVTSISGENIQVFPGSCETNLSGTCSAMIAITGAESGDSAEITYYAAGDKDAEVTISYTAP